MKKKPTDSIIPKHSSKVNNQQNSTTDHLSLKCSSQTKQEFHKPIDPQQPRIVSKSNVSNYKPTNKAHQKKEKREFSSSFIIIIPAIGSNGSKAIGGKSLTAEKQKGLEIGEGSRKKLETVVGDDHPLQTKLLEGNPALRKGLDPRVNVATPIMRDQIEISEMGLSL